jgi:hypothetical protein
MKEQTKIEGGHAENRALNGYHAEMGEQSAVEHT